MYHIIHARVEYELCVSFLDSWIDWRFGFKPAPSIEDLKFESPSKWNSYEGFILEHWSHVVMIVRSFFYWFEMHSIHSSRTMGRFPPVHWTWSSFNNIRALGFLCYLLSASIGWLLLTIGHVAVVDCLRPTRIPHGNIKFWHQKRWTWKHLMVDIVTRSFTIGRGNGETTNIQRRFIS